MKKILISLSLLSLLVGCGGGSSSKGSIDVADYLPSENTENTYIHTSSNGDREQTVEKVLIEDNNITIKVNDITTQTITTNDKSITVIDTETNTTKTYEYKRYIDEGSTLYTLSTSTTDEEIVFDGVRMGTKSTDSTKKCKLNNKIKELDKGTFMQFSGDILEFKCTESKSIVTHVRDDLPDYIDLQEGEEKTDDDISYFYLKKGIGLIAQINDDCIVKDKDNKETINDDLSECDEKKYVYKSLF